MTGVASAHRPLLHDDLMSRVEQLLSADRVVVANTRWRRARFALAERGAPTQTIIVARSTVRLAGSEEAADPSLPEVRISGTRQQWQVILDGQHGGLHRAWRYRELDFSGDPVATFDLWKTVWRLGEALAVAAKERDGVL